MLDDDHSHKVKTMNEKIELIRAITRSLAFLIPLVTLCVGLFLIPEVKDTIVGAIIGSATTAGVFYFKKSEDN